MKSCSPVPQHAVHHLQCRQTALLTSLLAKHQLSSEKSRGVCNEDSFRHQNQAGILNLPRGLWKVALGAKQGLQGTCRRVGKGQISPLPHTSTGRCRSINWRLHPCYNTEQPSATAPIHLAKPFQTHFYFCQGEFTNLIRCI